ncbi:DDE transposase family protein [Leptothoe kymatousa]|uniref:DDE transposase family protein n=1 Tax=Leptothoe kymatousa TaxID=2651727 RepID=UPI00389928CC
MVQRSEGACDIVTHTELGATDGEPQNWGPFASRSEAIAKRVGLIRAGKCLPK